MQTIKPYPFGSALGGAAPSPSHRPYASSSVPVAPDECRTVIKIIDWTAVAWAAFDFTVCAVAGIAEAGKPLGLLGVLLPGAVVAFVVLRQKLAGTVFDLALGTVRFYSWWRPRTLALADIHDANCEFAITLSPSRIALAMCGGAGGSKARRGRGGADQRTYMVNLSGTFGSRQVRFYSERWRDTFLSVLRAQAPTCRITRWF